MKIQVKRNGRLATTGELDAAVAGEPLPASHPAIELLESERQKHESTISRLTAQLKGVERVLVIAQAKLEAVEEALAAIMPRL